MFKGKGHTAGTGPALPTLPDNPEHCPQTGSMSIKAVPLVLETGSEDQ